MTEGRTQFVYAGFGITSCVFVENDVGVRLRRDANELRRLVYRFAVSAVAVAVAYGPKFSATGGGKDSRGRFALLNFCDARQHVECFRNFLDHRAAYDLFAGRKSVQHRVVAEVINRARNSGRAAEDVINRAG